MHFLDISQWKSAKKSNVGEAWNLKAKAKGKNLDKIWPLLKMGITYVWIWHSNISLPSSVLSAEQRINYLEKKRPLPKGRKITVSNNKISELWAFLFQCLVKWEERNIYNLQLTARFCFQTVIGTAHYRILILSYRFYGQNWYWNSQQKEKWTFLEDLNVLFEIRIEKIKRERFITYFRWY